MSQTNGKTAPSEKPADSMPYRPEASTIKVNEEIVTSLSRIVHEALYHAMTYVSLAQSYDRDKGTAVRYGHLVDATECAEVAMTYLALVKSGLNHRLRIEDDNTGINGDPWSAELHF